MLLVCVINKTIFFKKMPISHVEEAKSSTFTRILLMDFTKSLHIIIINLFNFYNGNILFQT